MSRATATTTFPPKKRARRFQPADSLTISECLVVRVLNANGGWCGRMTMVSQARVQNAWVLRDIYTSLIKKGWLILDTNGRVAFTARAIEYANSLKKEESV